MANHPFTHTPQIRVEVYIFSALKNKNKKQQKKKLAHNQKNNGKYKMEGKAYIEEAYIRRTRKTLPLQKNKKPKYFLTKMRENWKTSQSFAILWNEAAAPACVWVYIVAPICVFGVYSFSVYAIFPIFSRSTRFSTAAGNQHSVPAKMYIEARVKAGTYARTHAHTPTHSLWENCVQMPVQSFPHIPRHIYCIHKLAKQDGKLILK